MKNHDDSYTCDTETRVVYKDDEYALGMDGGYPYLLAHGKKYTLTFHPFEPCLYIKDGAGATTVVHNAFDPFEVLDAFSRGRAVTSVTGFVYGARDFCKMVESSAGAGDISIDFAERIFKKETEKTPSQKKARSFSGAGEKGVPPGANVVYDEAFCGLIEKYPDSAVEFRIVKSDGGGSYESHREALAAAARDLFFDGGEAIWDYDVGKAEGKETDKSELFAPVSDGKLNYRKAFLHPPYECGYTDGDFEKINAALFPLGTDMLEVYEWTTDWSEFFDDGHEWWGALCFTVYDKKLDRFVVIAASATD